MEIKKCQRCRAIPDASWKRYADGRYECPYCGSLNDLDAYDLADGAPRRQKSDDYTKIYSYLENLKFREAGEELRTLRVKYKGDATVYFLSVLADNCVCYTNNDNKTKWPYDKIPTLNDIKFKNILESENVKKALDLARDEEREMYRKTFEYMESVREKIEAAYKRGDYVFDVFISTKVNKIDENGNTVLNEYGAPVKTTDYELALGIYDLIKKQAPNCKVFLSEKMKDDFIGKEYENIIFSALHTAKVFILVGNTRENVDSNWVRNEWMRYLYLMNPKSEGYKDRHFVFVTQGMASSDVPGEFRDLEHVFWGKEVGQETRLIDFVKKGVAANIKKITSVDFGTSVGTIESIAPGSMNQGVLNIGVNYGNVDEDVDAAVGSAINSIEMAANNSNAANAKRKRDAAFKELQELASAHKDAYRARLYLLLKDTSYSKFEDYFANISEMAEKPEFAKGYFENASEDDAMKMIEKAIGSVIDSLNDASAPDKARVDSRKVLKNTLKDYLAHISKELLERLIKSLEKAIDSDYAKQKGWMIRTYLEVIRLKDGDDAQTYIARRINMLGKFEGKKIFFEEATSAIAEEVLAVDKGNAYAKWFLMCIKYFSSVFSTPQNAASGNLFKADLSDESVRKDWLEDFTFMFSYAPVEKALFHLGPQQETSTSVKHTQRRMVVNLQAPLRNLSFLGCSS